jgi:tetratricopeptide (TPR) repeat protein
MEARRGLHNRIVAAFGPILLALLLARPVGAQTEPLDRLFERLQTAEEGEAGRIEREIWAEWSKSGSPAMDLLLKRGRDAMEAGDTAAAIEHLTALIDHAPGFAEGWNARATAYFQAGLFGPSVADIAQTLKLNPRHFGALSGFGIILEETGRDDEALEVYRAALAIHPRLTSVEESIERLEAKATGQNL